MVTVLTAEGTRVIKGAGTFRVGDRPQVASDRFASLTRKRAATRVRAAPGPRARPFEDTRDLLKV